MLTAAQAEAYPRARYATRPASQLWPAAQEIAIASAPDALEKQIAKLPPDAVWPDPFFEEIAPMQVGPRLRAPGDAPGATAPHP